MISIVLPTDFSALSKIAIKYVIDLTQELDASLMLLNVVYVEGSPLAHIHSSIEDAIVKVTEEDFELLRNELLQNANKPLDLSYHIVKGYPVEKEIEKFATANKADLIVMGTKGAGSIQKVLFGSKASETIRKSSFPVLTIPKEARFKGIGKICCATDLDDAYTNLGDLMSFAKLFNASVELLHVFSEEKYVQSFDKEKFLSDMRIAYNYVPISFAALAGKNIINRIDHHLKQSPYDMLAMYTHRRGLIEKFYHPSITSELVQIEKMPLLAFKNTASDEQVLPGKEESTKTEFHD